MTTTVISEKSLEDAVEQAMLAGGPDALETRSRVSRIIQRLG